MGIRAQDFEELMKASTLQESSLVMTYQLLTGRKDSQSKSIGPAIEEHVNAQGATDYHESERYAFHQALRRRRLTHADIMACQMSAEMAQNGDWDKAWGLVKRIYESQVPRDRWEAWLREVLLREIGSGHCLTRI